MKSSLLILALQGPKLKLWDKYNLFKETHRKRDYDSNLFDESKCF